MKRIGTIRLILIFGVALAILQWVFGDGEESEVEIKVAVDPPPPKETAPPPLPRLADVELGRLRALSPFHDVCPKERSWVDYCGDAGRHAFNALHEPRRIALGWIVGVAWRPKDSLVSRSGQPVRLSPRDGFYYIIAQPPDDYIFLRQAREITAR